MNDVVASAASGGHDAWLIASALSAVALVVVLVAAAKVHPFLALIAGSAWLGVAGRLPLEDVVVAFQKGAGEMLGAVGVVLALGSIFGHLLSISGGAEGLVSAIADRSSRRALPWSMALVAMLLGVSLFFEVGLVLLMPIIALVARRSGSSSLRLGFPALAALSVCHGLIPPHPGPLIAVDALHADLGRTLAYGVLVAVPTVAIAGPGFGTWSAKRLGPRAFAVALSPAAAPPPMSADDARGAKGVPTAGVVFGTIALPIGLMLARTAIELARCTHPALRAIAALGHPIAAMTIGVFAASLTLGRAALGDMRRTGVVVTDALAPVAALLMIIGAGGGFKETLIHAGVAGAIGRVAASAHAPGLLLAWLLAAAIRAATGSATVATITASGMVGPIAPTLHVSAPLLALSIGAGSLFFSHVNDAGFWLVKEYFGLSLGETLRSWSVMETLISVVGLGCVVTLQLLHIG